MTITYVRDSNVKRNIQVPNFHLTGLCLQVELKRSGNLLEFHAAEELCI